MAKGGALETRGVRAARAWRTRPACALGALVLCASAWAQTGWQPSGTNIYFNSGNVGIGTTSPGQALSVADGDIEINSESPGRRVGFLVGDTFTNSSSIATARYGLTMGTDRGYMVGVSGWAGLSLYTGDTERLRITNGGNVGIGATNPQQKLSVNGTIGAREVVVTSSGWSDYVFRPGYRLRPLSEVALYIKEKHQLPDIPTESEVKENGISVGEMQAKLLAKIEELTLHMIKSEERNQDLARENQRLLREELSNRRAIERLESTLKIQANSGSRH